MKRKFVQRVGSLAVEMALCVSAPLSAFAAVTLDLKDGDITIDETDWHQALNYGAHGNDITIKSTDGQGNNATTSNIVTIVVDNDDNNNTKDGEEVEEGEDIHKGETLDETRNDTDSSGDPENLTVTLDNVNIATSGDYADAPVSVKVAKGEEVDIELDGDNKLGFSNGGNGAQNSHAALEIVGTNENDFFPANRSEMTEEEKQEAQGKLDAEIKTTSGTVVIMDADGDGGTLTTASNSASASIGTEANHDLNATLTINSGTIVAGRNIVENGNGDIQADGAGIGTGSGGDIASNGSINIEGTANVTGISRNGAGIGTGTHGKIIGEEAETEENKKGAINISGQAIVTGISTEYGAGIGTGEYEGIDGRSINIDTEKTVTGISKQGAGIGTGYNFQCNGDTDIKDGQIVISNGTVTGESGEKTSIVFIKDKYGKETDKAEYNEDGSIKTTTVQEVYSYSAGIGTGRGGSLDNATIHITGTAKVTGTSTYGGAGIGTGSDAKTDSKEIESNMENGSVILIDGDAKVNVDDNDDAVGASAYGAGIGTGMNGDIDGSQIKISGNAIVGGASTMGGAGIGTGWAGNIQNNGSVEIGGGDTVVGTSEYGAGIGTGYCGNIQNKSSIKISGGNTVKGISGRQNDEGEIITESYGAGIGTGGYGSINSGSIEISGGDDVEGIGGYGAGIGSGCFGNADSILISGGKITGTSYGGGAGIGGGYGYAAYNLGTANVSITGGTITATSYGNGAGIGGGANAAATVTIAETESTDTNAAENIKLDVTAIGGLGAAGIGGGADTTTSSKVTITRLNNNKKSLFALHAYADGTKMAIETGNETTDQNVINGRFYDSTDGKGMIAENAALDKDRDVDKEVKFVVINADGETVNTFSLPARNGATYRSFAVDLPSGGTYYVFNSDGLYSNSITGYSEEKSGKLVLYTVAENTMLDADKVQFPAAKATYEFQSEPAGKTLPKGVLDQLPGTTYRGVFSLDDLLKLIAPDKNLTAVTDGSDKWTFKEWNPDKKNVLNDDGTLASENFVGYWVYESTGGGSTPDPTPTPTPEPQPDEPEDERPEEDEIIVYVVPGTEKPAVPAAGDTPAAAGSVPAAETVSEQPAAAQTAKANEAKNRLPQTGANVLSALGLAFSGAVLSLGGLFAKGRHEKK